MESGRQSHSRGVGASPSQRSIIVVFVNALESGDYYDPAVFQFSFDTLRVDPFKPRVSVNAGGMHRHLECVQRHRRDPHFVQGHAHQRHRHLLPDSEKHIHFSFGRFFVDILRHGDKLVRVFSHCGENHHDVVSFSVFLRAPSGHVKDPLFISHGRSAEFLYD